MRERAPLVPVAVRRAFGVEGEVVPLAGGEGVTFHVGEAVLKRVHDVDEAEWTQDLQSRIDEDGFRLARPLPGPDGRWTGNVYLDPSGVPVVLDISRYIRPRHWGSAIVVADAVLWNGADLWLAESFAATTAAQSLVGRALIFRMVAEQLAADPRHRARLEPDRRVLAALT